MSTWKHISLDLIFIARRNLFDLIDEDLRGHYYLGWLDFPTTIMSATSVRIIGPITRAKLHTTIRGRFVDVYCSDTIDNCRKLVEDLKQKMFTLLFPGGNPDQPDLCQFQSSVCTTCYGIHESETCPFVVPRDVVGAREHGHDDSDSAGGSSQSTGTLTTMGTLTTSLFEHNPFCNRRSDSASEFPQSTGTRTTSLLYEESPFCEPPRWVHGHPVLVQNDLVNQIIKRVLELKFILVSASYTSYYTIMFTW